MLRRIKNLILHRQPVVNNLSAGPWLKGEKPAPYVAPTIGAPVNTILPVISGPPTVGSVLTITPGFWTGNPSIQYEWMVGNAPIAGANGLTYKVQAGAAGQHIKVREVATNSEGVHSVFSNVIDIAP